MRIRRSASRLQLGLTQSLKECTELMDNTNICCIIIEGICPMANLV